MARYDVYVFCNECGDVHPMGITIELKDGPADRKSIGDAYAGKEIPPNIVNLINNRIVCPRTRKWFTQKDNNQVFIIPIK